MLIRRLSLAARGQGRAVASLMTSASTSASSGGGGGGAAAAAPTGGVTYAQQLSLPRLPVPPLAATVETYVRTLEPFATPEEMKHVREMAKAFVADDGIGRKLQARLLERRDAHKDSSWLIYWWNSMMYMGYRDPTVINVSYFYAFADDVNAWRMKSQAARAAGLVDEMLRRRDALVACVRRPANARAMRGPGVVLGLVLHCVHVLVSGCVCVCLRACYGLCMYVCACVRVQCAPVLVDLFWLCGVGSRL